MSNQHESSVTRRDFVRTAAAASIAATFPASFSVFAQGSDTIKVGVIGCGGRGTGAALDCLKADPGVEIVALGDLVPDRVESSFARLTKEFPNRVKVPAGNRFTGFDNYKGVLSVPGINLILTAAPPGFRPIHVKAAVEAGKHVFMEKPVAVDPVGVRSIIATSDLAAQKKLAIVAGTQRRHQKRYLEMMKRIQDGQIGEIVAAQVYWNQGDLWVKQREPSHDRDRVAVPQLALLHLDVGRPHRRAARAQHRRRELGDGRDAEERDGHGRAPGAGRARVRQHLRPLRRGVRVSERRPREQHVPADEGLQRPRRGADRRHQGRGVEHVERHEDHRSGAVRRSRRRKSNPYVQEHIDLIASIRKGTPLNEGRQVAESTLCAIMGRMSAYTGRALSWEWAMNTSKLDLSPAKDEFGPNPVDPAAIPGTTPLV